MLEKKDPVSLFHTCVNVLEGSYGSAIQTLGIILFVLIFNYLIKALLLRLRSSYMKEKKVWKLSFVSALYRPLTYYVWFVAGVASIDIISLSLLGRYVLEMHLINSIGGVLAFAWFLLNWNAQVSHYMLDLSHHHQIALTPGKLDLISKLSTIGIIFITIFLLMDVTGRNMQTLIAFGGIGGLALAFASQQVVSNFFGGLMIYLTHPFTIGENVQIPERKIEGDVEEIGWYMTLIRNPEKRPIYVPNSIFAQTVVINPSRKSHERIQQRIGLSYKDIGRIKEIVDQIKLMLLKHPHIDREQKAEAFFVNFGATSLEVEISAYISSSEGIDFPTVRQDVYLKIAEIIAQQGAELATPTNIVEFPGATLKNPPLIPPRKIGLSPVSS